jgi:hypothetical protein
LIANDISPYLKIFYLILQKKSFQCADITIKFRRKNLFGIIKIINMKWGFSFHEDQKILLVAVTGQFSLSEQKKMFEEVGSFKEELNEGRILFDAQQLGMTDVDGEIIKSSVLVAKNFCQKFPNCKIAGLVGHNLLNFGLGRQFENYSEIEGNMTFQIFKNEKQAIQWLLNESHTS